MNRPRNQSGNLLILTLAVLGVAGLAIAFVVIGYSNLLGGGRKAETAIDAAALVAARDIGKIVIDDPHFGPVGLVDGAFQDQKKRPVLGINTILATARLDMVIARQLGNSSMQYFSSQDATWAREAADRLDKVIKGAASGAKAKDKDGHEIELLANVTRAFDTNGNRSGQGKRTGNIKIRLGTLKVPAGTNTPVPTPADSDINAGNSMWIDGLQCYKSGTSYACGDTNITFAPLGAQPTLIDNSLFADPPEASGIAETVVQVCATQELSAVTSSGFKNAGAVKILATAIAGGARITPPSGTLCLTFRQGIPYSPGNLFSSPKSVMNASMIAKGGGSGDVEPWFRDGNWLNVGNRGMGSDGIDISDGDGYRGRSVDNPSIALSVVVYDWLKAMGLRPRVDTVVDCLSADFTETIRKASSSSGPSSDGWLQPAYAQGATGGRLPVAGGIYLVSQLAGEPDQRDYRLRQFDSDHARQYQLVFNQEQAGISLARQPQVKVFAVTSLGQPTTTGGASVGLFPVVERAVMNQLAAGMSPLSGRASVAQQTFDNAMLVAQKQKMVFDTAISSAADDDNKLEEKENELNRTQEDLVVSEKWLNKYLPLGKEGIGAWLAAGYDRAFLNVDPDNLKAHINELRAKIQSITDEMNQIGRDRLDHIRNRDKAKRMLVRANAIARNARLGMEQGTYVLKEMGPLSAMQLSLDPALANVTPLNNTSPLSNVTPLKDKGADLTAVEPLKGKGADLTVLEPLTKGELSATTPLTVADPLTKNPGADLTQVAPVTTTSPLGSYNVQGLGSSQPLRVYIGAGRLSTPSKVASVEEIEGTGPIPTGEGHDWAATVQGMDPVSGKGGSPSLHFYEPMTRPSSSVSRGLDYLCQPAYACSQRSGANQTFLYIVQGDAAKSGRSFISGRRGSGEIQTMVSSATPFLGAKTLPGQIHYQALNSLKVRTRDGDVYWSVQARDNGATSDGCFFATQGAYSNGRNGKLPSPGFEWQLYSPILGSTNRFTKNMNDANGQNAGTYETAPEVPPFHG